MSAYLGSGYRCQVSIACGFRVLPASGEDRDLDEAARIRAAHERSCRFAGIGLPPPKLRTHNIDDRRTALSSAALAIEAADAPDAHTKYNREPSGRGWKAVIQAYVREHPRATLSQVAQELCCNPSTAATYIGAARRA